MIARVLSVVSLSRRTKYH